MSRPPDYTPYHPKWHRESKPIFWWVRRWADFRFILRELTSFAVAYFSVILVLVYRAILIGPQQYEDLTTTLGKPIFVAIHCVALMMLIFHTVTWFQAAPRALALRLGKWRLKDSMIIAGNLVAWAAVSAFIYLLYSAV